ncbi:DUF427 domain-containing protein [Sporolactobacillus shoreicorticis]|uniref:DUF427 domain-containing protein n=1 Tax=Sporolactobacillus shoreicorticis TaxID=1923877 RepID=A0ABW5S3A1_9BACL|nr:DUF427 domain-containing protein [Sporolactobacillus shoreicorticis]MCO7124298.1 DUF427 domain-containing protein [Sporolactobacillus shoreicorticis]
MTDLIHTDLIHVTKTKVTTKKKTLLFESTPRWVRATFNGVTIADSKKVMLLHERGRLPVYYFPENDVRTDLFTPSETSNSCSLRGEANYWSIKVGDCVAEDAVWCYQNPGSKIEKIKGYYAFCWNKLDAWYEGEEEIYLHPRDPYKRIDALYSSRHIRIVLDGITLAESSRPVIVFETGVPVRYYLPKENVVMEHLVPSETSSRCPYKGIATYWSAVIDGNTYEDIVWRYREPIAEMSKIKGLLSFYNEKVQVFVNDVLEEKPSWYLSSLDTFNEHELH